MSKLSKIFFIIGILIISLLYSSSISFAATADMNIDGVSGGVSGLPESFLSQVAQTDGDYLDQIAEHKVPRACDSIWIFFQGKSIRLAFLSVGAVRELIKKDNIKK